jgi:hypothetical protein
MRASVRCAAHSISIEVRDRDFLVLGSESAWAGLEGPVAVQAVSTWIREQGAPALWGQASAPRLYHSLQLSLER